MIAPALADVIDRVDIDVTRRRATVGDREVVADSRKQLRAMLAGALYDTWHVGRRQPPPERHRAPRDDAFETLLRKAVPHETSVVRVRADADGIVRLNGVRVRVPSDAVDGDGLRLPAVLPAVSPGYLMVNGSRGTGLSTRTCVRVYLNVATAEQAPVVWGAVLARLEERRIAYKAKVASSRATVPRRDGIVVYLGPQSWSAVGDVRAAATATGGLGTDVSAYVARLDAGVGCAWEPEDPRPGMRGMSFGEHRSHAVAAGLVAAAVDGRTGTGTGSRRTAVAEALMAARIDPARTFRNVESPELSHVDA